MCNHIKYRREDTEKHTLCPGMTREAEVLGTRLGAQGRLGHQQLLEAGTTLPGASRGSTAHQ